MLNIFKKKQKNYNDKSLNNNTNSINIKENFQILNKVDKNEYKNLIYYPSSTKEWFNSIYSYNKSYTKSLISIWVTVNNLFISYFNMLEDKIKILFKRRRHNKSRYSADKIYVSRAETKHMNTKLVILFYVYNKQKASVERYIRKHINFTITQKYLVDTKIVEKLKQKNRITHTLKKKIFLLKKFNIAFMEKTNNLLKDAIPVVKSKVNLHKIPVLYIYLLKRLYRVQLLIFNAVNLINFNKSKFSTLVLNWKDLGIMSLLKKMYNKNVVVKVVDLKSIHLNSDVFSAAVVLKLRDRQNKVVTVLRKAVLQMVKIPDLHTLRTHDTRMADTSLEMINMNEENALNVIKQQVVSGVRFEAAGRLTRRLTAMRAIFKLRYLGSLKNLRSSLNNLASTILRGFVKSNAQYVLIMSKTRNGSFGLKTWVSSHWFIPANIQELGVDINITPGGIDTTTIAVYVTGFLAAFLLLSLYRRFRKPTTLHLQVILVRNYDTLFYAVIDKNDFSGSKLKLLYLNNNKVEKRYVKWNGLIVYAIMDADPDWSMVTAEAYNTYRDEYRDAFRRRFYAEYEHSHETINNLFFPAPRKEYWEFLVKAFDIQIYHGVYEHKRIIYPFILPNGNFVFQLDISRSTLAHMGSSIHN